VSVLLLGLACPGTSPTSLSGTPLPSPPGYTAKGGIEEGVEDVFDLEAEATKEIKRCG